MKLTLWYMQNINLGLVCFGEKFSSGFFVPLENVSLIWRRHRCWWRSANFYLCSTLISIKQSGFLACHTHSDTGHMFIMVISQDMKHSYLLSSVEQWSCHYLFPTYIRSVAAGIRGKRGACSNRLRDRPAKCITELHTFTGTSMNCSWTLFQIHWHPSHIFSRYNASYSHR